MKYGVFGHVIETDHQLPELPPAPASEPPRFTIAWVDAVDVPNSLRWSVVWPGDPEVSFGRDGAVRFLRYGEVARVRISDACIEIAIHGEIDPGGVRHMFLDQILPLALASSGETVLHASAVEMDGAAVLFVGEAGSGKSTLAAALSSLGAPVLADDGILLQPRDGAVWAVPSYPGLRLWPDAAHIAAAGGFSGASLASGRLKQRFVPSVARRPASALPIAGIYSLAAGSGAPAFARLARRDAVVELVRHAFTADVENRDAILAHLDRATCWSGRLEMWRLALARDLAQLEPAARAVLAHVRGRAALDTLQKR